MRVPAILSFVWCAVSVLLGEDAIVMGLTFAAMVCISYIAMLFGREGI